MTEATNADDTKVKDDDLDVSEEGLAAAKAESEGVESDPQDTDEPDDSSDDDDDSDEDAGEDDGQTDDDATDDSSDEDDEPTFVKKYPQIKGDTPEEYLKNLETAYNNSTAEAMRLKKAAQPAPQTTTPAPEGTPPEEEQQPAQTQIPDTLSLYAKQKLDEEIDEAYEGFQKDYPQVIEQENYQAFTREVSVLSQTILATQGRLAPPKEVYRKAAISLGWEKQSKPDSKEELAMALKGKASASKSSGVSKGSPKQPKISQAELETNRKMYPNKTDAEIIKELTPYHS